MPSYRLILVLVLATTLFAQPQSLGLALEDAPGGQGARIAQLAPNGLGARAGLETGDIILAVNGVAANGSLAISKMVRALPAGRNASLTILRGGQKKEIAIPLGGGIQTQNQPSARNPILTAPSAEGPILTNPAPAAPLTGNYTRVLDPIEHGFAIDAPAGWTTVSALARGGLVQVNPYLRSLSPDKMTYMLFGDPAFPSFLVPNQMRNTIGMREGATTGDKVGGMSEIRRYLPGAQFARFFGEIEFGGLCRNLKPLGTHDRPDYARKIEQMDHNVIPTRYDAGEAEFSCVHNGQEMIAYSSAVTWITRDQLGMWVVRGFGGFITPKANAAQAKAMLEHIVESLRWEPDWTRRQTELSRQAGEIIKRRIAEFEQRQAAFSSQLNGIDKSFEDMDDIITGTGHYVDPQSGKKYNLNTSYHHEQWIDDSGRIKGGRRPPGTSWHQLTEGR